jgi:NADPH-dependent 2,4-dienoyl-CoA reductase/sulfur reductase-like enzyme
MTEQIVWRRARETFVHHGVEVEIVEAARRLLLSGGSDGVARWLPRFDGEDLLAGTFGGQFDMREVRMPACSSSFPSRMKSLAVNWRLLREERAFALTP